MEKSPEKDFSKFFFRSARKNFGDAQSEVLCRQRSSVAPKIFDRRFGARNTGHSFPTRDRRRRASAVSAEKAERWRKGKKSKILARGEKNSVSVSCVQATLDPDSAASSTLNDPGHDTRDSGSKRCFNSLTLSLPLSLIPLSLHLCLSVPLSFFLTVLII